MVGDDNRRRCEPKIFEELNDQMRRNIEERAMVSQKAVIAIAMVFSSVSRDDGLGAQHD